MPSRTYTDLIWGEDSLGPGTATGPTVPVGQLWVVRDAVFWFEPNSPWEAIPGIVIQSTAAGGLIGGVGTGQAVGGEFYHHELRQAVGAGETFTCFTVSTGWRFRLTGYKFTEPQMPATFGTGTVGSTFDTRSQPIRISVGGVGPFGSKTIHLPGALILYVITSIDMVTDGGGSGGFTLWGLTPAGVNFWAVNVGANIDTFHWRGWLPCPGLGGPGITIDNNTVDTSMSYVVSGLLFPEYGPNDF